MTDEVGIRDFSVSWDGMLADWYNCARSNDVV